MCKYQVFNEKVQCLTKTLLYMVEKIIFLVISILENVYDPKYGSHFLQTIFSHEYKTLTENCAPGNITK